MSEEQDEGVPGEVEEFLESVEDGSEKSFREQMESISEEGNGDGDLPAEPTDDIDRIRMGIPGLEELIVGGVPKESLALVMGGPGTGKTTFAIQFLYRALEQGEDAVYFTLDQTERAIVRTADALGMDFTGHQEEGSLEVIRMDPVEMMTNMHSIQNDLANMISDFGASRVAIDSVSHIEMMYEDPVDRRDQIFYFSDLLKRTGITTLVTSEASLDNPYASRYGIAEYTSDAAFVLRQVRDEDLQETHLAFEAMKIRDTDHSRKIKPFEFTENGIVVYSRSTIF